MLGDFSNEALISALYMIPALLVSLAIHEFAHAYTAYKLGDIQQKNDGRLTLDPFAHIDWVGFISILLLGFGWGKPVQVNENNFKNPKKGMMITAFAGPFANFLLAVVLTILLKLGLITGLVSTASTTKFGAIVLNMFLTAIQFNIVFAAFNMLPIPPFDGAKVLFYFLPRKWKVIEEKMEQYALFILIFLIVTNVHTILIAPLVNGIMWILQIIITL